MKDTLPVLIITAAAPFLGAVIAGCVALAAHGKAAKHRLRVEYRLKLLMLAHEAIYEVTRVALEGFEKLVAHDRDAAVAAGQPDAAWRSRQELQRVAVHLPPELVEAFDKLAEAFGSADDGRYIAANFPKRDDGARSPSAHRENFAGAMQIWRKSARAWKLDAWKEGEKP